MKKISFFVLLIICGISSSAVLADCVNLGNANKWSRIDNHKIILYRGSNGLALLNTPYCFIYATSDLRLVKEDVCNWDKIIVDGEVCDVRSVNRL